MKTRAAAALVLIAGLGLTVTACDQGASAKPSTTTATVTAEPTTPSAADAAYAKARIAIDKWLALPPNGEVSGDFMTTEYLKAENAGRQELATQGITVKGSGSRTLNVRPVEYRTVPDWATVMRVCTESDPRLIDKNGQDLTVDEQGKPIPVGLRKTSSLVTLNTPDSGASWQIDSVQQEGAC